MLTDTFVTPPAAARRSTLEANEITLRRRTAMKTIKFSVGGMSCAGCARTVEEALASVPGVQTAKVDVLGRTATIMATEDVTDQTLVDAVKAAGYSARRLAAQSQIREAEERKAARVALSRTIGIGGLLLGGWALGSVSSVPKPVSLAMVILAMVLAAYPILWRAIKALLVWKVDADVLVGIAVIAAASVGEFVAAGEVAFILLLGAQLEEYTTRRARKSLGSLLSLVPATAHVRRSGADTEIPAAEVQVGDVVIVRAGERIPVDGVVRQGTASVNQAPVTGESMPVEKSGGDEVFVGTLTESGALIIEATRVGEDTTLARIAQLVEAAQQKRSADPANPRPLAGLARAGDADAWRCWCWRLPTTFTAPSRC